MSDKDNVQKPWSTLPKLNIHDYRKISFRSYVNKNDLPISTARNRASSLFSVEDYEVAKKEQKKSKDYKGSFKLTYYDKPEKLLVPETPQSFLDIEKPSYRKKRAISTLSEASQCMYTGANKPTDIPYAHLRNNSYEMEPQTRFNETMVRNIIKEEIQKLVKKVNLTRSKICTELCDNIRERLKTCPSERYKYIVTVTLGDMLKQGLNIGSQFFWDKERDNFVSESFLNNNHFIVVNVFAIYFE